MTPARGLTITEARREHFRLLDEEWRALAGHPDRARLFETVACPVCGDTAPAPLFEKHGTPFVRCPDCGLVYINPQLTEDALVRHFETSPAWDVWSRHVLPSPEQQAFDEAKYRRALADLPVPAGRRGRLLDVGASSGTFLALAQGAGWEVDGVEPSGAACEVARARHGLKLHHGSLASYDAPAPFDVITFWASLEYLKDPARALRKATGLLRPGGHLLVLISGSAHSLLMRVLQEHCEGFLFNRPWYFTPASLDRLAAPLGLTLVGRRSIVPGLDVIARYLDYRAPYTNEPAPLFDEADLAALEALVARRHMGYKFESLYARPEGAA